MSIDLLDNPLFPPFAVDEPHVSWLIDTRRQSLIDDLRNKREFAGLAVVIVDLTMRTQRADGAGWMTFDGWNMHDQRFAASILKIAVMFAAFRLRENFRSAAKGIKAVAPQDLVEIVTDDWRPVVESAIPDGRPDFPSFRNILDVRGGNGAWTINFSQTFKEHLILMISHSARRSAAYCIDALGHQYINGALAAEGLYSRGRGGLWVGTNYDGRDWKLEPLAKLTHLNATADTLAAFLTLVESGRLVGPEASESMRKVMRLTSTWFQDGLLRARPPRPITDHYGKVGLHGTYHDCAVIERTPPGRSIRYAVVALGAHSDATLHRLIVKLDDYIQGSG